ncbi:MAG: ABC transporter ATP-binding protein [Actinomycetota bacterium]
MPSDAPTARCAELVRTYPTATGDVPAIRGITAEVPRGALTAVLGPSGSGKSTLLRLMAGMDRPTSGSLVLEGTEVHRVSWRRLRRLRREAVGYVFQRPSDNFVPYLTVGEHLRLAARGASASPLVDPAELLGRLGIAHRVDHLPDALSGGEQQRGALAQALVAGATMIVADEPTAELDSLSARSLIDTLARLRDAGVTFLVGTHDPALRRAADQVLELEHGALKGTRDHPAAALRRDRPDRWFAPSEAGGTAATAPVLEVEGVSKFYRRGSEVVHALEDVSLEVGAGETVGLVGRSGSGKTTLLHVIGGWEDPDQGRIVVSGQPSKGPPMWSEVAVLPQKFGLIEDLSVRANIEYPARLAGRLAKTHDLVEELIEGLGLSDMDSRFPGETSVGEQQRTALARALALRPKLLLADEPTGHQDEVWGRAVLSTLRRAASWGTACLVATHNREVAERLDRTIAVSDGRVAESAEGDGGAVAPSGSPFARPR